MCVQESTRFNSPRSNHTILINCWLDSPEPFSWIQDSHQGSIIWRRYDDFNPEIAASSTVIKFGLCGQVFRGAVAELRIYFQWKKISLQGNHCSFVHPGYSRIYRSHVSTFSLWVCQSKALYKANLLQYYVVFLCWRCSRTMDSCQFLSVFHCL